MSVVGVPTGQVAFREWVAQGLMRDLEGLDPEFAARRRAQLETLGARWLTAVPDDVDTTTDLVTVADAVKVLGVPRSRIDTWRFRRQVSRVPGGVLLSECRALMARIDGAPEPAAAAGPSRTVGPASGAGPTVTPTAGAA